MIRGTRGGYSSSMSGRVTVITPVFNEQDSLPPYVEALRRVLFARSEKLQADDVIPRDLRKHVTSA